MATYYVRTDGNDTNTGLGPATNQAWASLTKALSSTGIASGDIVYVAPGRYVEFVTVGIANPTALTRIVGDPTASQFSGITAGEVLWSARNAAGTKINSNLLIYTTKNYLSFENIHFEFAPTSGQQSSFRCVTSTNTRLLRCQFTCTSSTPNTFITFTSSTSNALNLTIDSCSFFGGDVGGGSISITGQSVSDSSVIRNSLFVGFANAIVTNSLQAKFVNNTFFFITSSGVYVQSGSTSFPSSFANNLFIACGNAVYAQSANICSENYNRFIGCTNTTVNLGSLGANSSTLGGYGIYGPYALQQGLTYGSIFSSTLGSFNTSFGTTVDASTSDIYGVTWTGTSPDAGSATYRNLSSVGQYNPTERNSSLVTIAPGATSQSIELYLGATGLTASTSGLSARYNRTRTASVSIPLVARTIAQAWTSGGFAEVDVTNMPGVYRLDLPDAALAAGADDVTVVVRGASGTNGAVISIRLATSGLTSAETASAVWGASPAPYNDATTLGGILNQIDQTATGIDTAVQDVPSNVWEEMRATHTTAGTFGEYVNAELVTPVTSAALVRMGPYEVKADGLGASDPLDIQKGAQHGVDIQCVDANGSGIDITSATVTAKVYNSGATLVDTYACTATYAADGRATFTIDTTVTDTPGTYTATITRTTGASDTQVFGPLRIYVRDI
jgi:hypothetical protein